MLQTTRESDCCCRLAGSRYATHVGCLPQPFPVGESDLCKRRSESTPPITAFHSQDMDCKIEWPGPRRWCNLSLYCFLIGVCTQATLASSSLLKLPVLCPPYPAFPLRCTQLAWFTRFHPLCCPSSMCSLNSIAALHSLCGSLVDACPTIHIIGFRRTALKSRFITSGWKEGS